MASYTKVFGFERGHLDQLASSYLKKSAIFLEQNPQLEKVNYFWEQCQACGIESADSDAICS
jgi:hypothetical protein